MFHYLYAIVDRLPDAWRAPTAAFGVGPATGRWVRGLCVIGSEVDRAPSAGPRALAVHHDVVASVMDAPAMLPLHFGMVIPAGDVEAWLDDHWGTVRDTLDHLRGHVEMSVKLLRLECGGEAGAWRRARAGRPSGAEAAQLRRLGDRLVEQADVDHWSCRFSGSDGNVAASVAFLVARPDVDSFLTRIAPVASHATGVAVVPTGPWPAYSFVPPLEREAPACAGGAGALRGFERQPAERGPWASLAPLGRPASFQERVGLTAVRARASPAQPVSHPA